MPLIDGGTVPLPRIIGKGRALDMIFTGREIDAKTSLEWGLASRVAGQAHALSASITLAECTSGGHLKFR